MDTCCTAMKTGNLLVHQYLMTRNHSLVAEYIQFDNNRQLDPLQLNCTVGSLYGKVTVCYWLRNQ